MFDVRWLTFDVKGVARSRRALSDILSDILRRSFAKCGCARKMRALSGVFAFYPVERFLARFERAFELARFDCFKYCAELRAWFHSHRD